MAKRCYFRGDEGLHFCPKKSAVFPIYNRKGKGGRIHCGISRRRWRENAALAAPKACIFCFKRCVAFPIYIEREIGPGLLRNILLSMAKRCHLGGASTGIFCSKRCAAFPIYNRKGKWGRISCGISCSRLRENAALAARKACIFCRKSALLFLSIIGRGKLGRISRGTNVSKRQKSRIPVLREMRR